MSPSRLPGRRSARFVAALAGGLALAVILVLDAQSDRRGGGRGTTLAGVMSALERTAVRGDSIRLTPEKLFYARIAYRDLAVRVDGRRGAWAAFYRQVIRRWVAPDGSARLLFRGGREVLVGPRDRTRWRADGSLPLGESAHKSWEVDFRRGRFLGANLSTTHLTYRDLLALPTNERALSNRLDALLPPLAGAQHERVKAEAIAELLGANPTPPAVRAALYRVLAGLEGLRLEGMRNDPYGRRGIALAIADDATTTIVLADPTSARVLGLEDLTRRRLSYADVRPGDVISEHWFLAARIVAAFRGHLVARACPPGGSGFGCWVWSS
jgi:hypothetical protein